MAEPTPLMQLATIFAEWQPVASLFGRFNYTDYRDKYQQLGELVQLFRKADPLERTEVRRLLRKPGKRLLSDFVEAWRPVQGEYPATWEAYQSASQSFRDTNFSEYVRLILAARAMGYVSIDYRDDLLTTPWYVTAVKDRGLDWRPFGEEFGRLDADYVPTPQDDTKPLTDQQVAAINADIDAQTRLIEADPKVFDAYLKRAIAYTELHELDKALRDLQQACRLDYKNPDAHFQRGRVYALMGNISEAFDDYVEVVSKFPNYAQADMMRARIREWRNQR